MILAAAEWWVGLRDAAVVVTAICAAPVAMAGALKLPWISRPVRWVWRQLTEDAIAAYWARHREVAQEAVSPQMLDLAVQHGTLAERHDRLRQDFDQHLAEHHT